MNAEETTKIPLWTTDDTTSLGHDQQSYDCFEQAESAVMTSADSLNEEYLPETPHVTQRHAILGEDQDKASLLNPPPRTDTTYMVNHGRTSNQRRGKQVGGLLILMFAANLLMLAAGGLWLYNHLSQDFEEKFSRVTSKSPGDAPVNQPASPFESSQKADPQYQSHIAKLEVAIQSAQTRIADVEEQGRRQAASLEALAAKSNTALLSQPAKPTKTTEPATMVNESALPSPQSELVLLKERNRLTSYADEAIATASRASYEKLWAALDDARLANLIHASRSEILRVQNYYLSGSRLEQYQISVADYYPDLVSLRDSQLKDDQLIALLSNSKNPWQVRMKAANLLGQRRSTAVGDALAKAIKDDNNLDVVKEATFSFEQMTGYRARIFETSSLDAWWKQYNTVPPLQKILTKKNTGNEPAAEKTVRGDPEKANSNTTVAKP